MVKHEKIRWEQFLLNNYIQDSQEKTLTVVGLGYRLFMILDEEYVSLVQVYY